MGVRKTTIFVSGMTCSSCEARIARALENSAGVSQTRASLSGGRVDIEYDDDKITIEALKAVIEKAGYRVGKGGRTGTVIAVGIGMLLAAAYMIANAAGVFNAIPAIHSTLSYGMLFVVGLLTSVHCVAMCGGISLSQSVAKPESGRDSRFKRLSPGLLYNSGRVISYTIVGGAAGALGAAFNFSPALKGGIAAAAGVFMVLLGLKMLGVRVALPRLSRFTPAPLKRAAGRFSSALAARGSFAVGLLNGLMPCGPLQTMQLYALGTGSFLAGALAMFIFSMGTVPLMLAFGLASALLPRRIIPGMIKASSVLVMFLGLVTLGRAAALSGIALPEFGSPKPVQAQFSAGVPVSSVAGETENAGTDAPVQAALSGGVQSVLTDFGSSGYYLPFTVQAGIPVKWTIRVKADGLNGCNNPLTIPSYGIRRTLVPGDNLIEFTPKKEGVITYSCWMGMISSRITVQR